MATTVLTPDLRQGTIYSSPLEWPAGMPEVTARGLLSDTDAADVGNTLTIGLEVSFDEGMTYQQSAQAVWVGGSTGMNGQFVLPSLGTGFSLSGQLPSHARIRLELPATLSVGATLEFAAS